MKGRLENERKLTSRLDEKMKAMPEYVVKFSYTIRSNEYTTVNSYVTHVWRYLSWLKEQGIDIEYGQNLDIDSDYYIGMYLSYIKIGGENRQKETSFGYRSVAWTALNLFFEYMIGHNYVTSNPMNKVRRDNPNKDHVSKDILTPLEINKVVHNILDGVSDSPCAVKAHEKYCNRDLLLFLLLLDTGSRITGILELNIEDVNMQKKVVRITSKGSISRDYRLADATCEYLKIWIADRERLLRGKETPALFTSKNGTRLTYRAANFLIKKYTFNIDKRITPHTTRSTVATMLYEQTGDIELVKDKLGHSSTETTRRYIVKGEEHMEKAYRASEILIENALR